MSDAKFQLQSIRDPRLAVHATSAMPAWLWSIDGARVLWANPVAARIFGADHSAQLADKIFSPADPHRRQVMQLAAQLSQSGATRMERLRGFGAPLGRPVTCACARLSFADGSTAILVAAAEAVGRTLAFSERIENLLAGIAMPALAFTLNGALIGANTSGTAIAARTSNLSTSELETACADAARAGEAELKLDFAHGSINRLGAGSEAVLLAIFDQVNLPKAAETNIATVSAKLEPESIAIPAPVKSITESDAPQTPKGVDTHWSVIKNDTANETDSTEAAKPDSDFVSNDVKRSASEAIVETPMNVVPFRAVNEPKAPVLTTVESNAFEELARRLSAQLDSPKATLTESVEIPVAVEETAHASSTDARPIENPPAFLRPEAPAPRVASAQDSQLLDRLPVGILVYRLDRLMYANRAFFESTGFSSLHELNDAGGLDALYVEPTTGTGGSTSKNGTAVTISAISHTNGVQSETAPQDAKLFAISWDGEPAMALMFSGAHAEPIKTPAAAAPPQDPRLAEDLSTILDTTAEGIVIFDGLGRILSCNRSAEALFGRSGDEIASLNLIELFAPESQRAVLDYLENAKSATIASMLDHGRDMLGHTRDGHTIPLSMTMGRTRPDSARFFAVFRDLSTVKKSESEIRQAHRQAERATNARSDVLTRISHEVRMPLNAIIGFADVMIEERFGALGNERYAEYMKDIRASGERVMAIIDDLLDLSRIESGKMELAFVSQNLNSLVEQCVAVMQPQANRERKIIRTSLAHALPNVKADARALRQIALNLIESSMQLANAGGQVIVSTANTDFGDIVLRVRDTGHGLNDNQIAAAMAPFRASTMTDQIPSNNSTVSLSLTKALVEANRAQFHIKTAGHAGTLIEVVFSHASAIA